MTEESKKKIENVYKYSSNSIEKIEAAKFGYALASQEHREEWVSVEDRLPEEGGRYLCYCESVGDLGKSYFQWNCAYDPQTKSFHDFSYSFKDGERVTHWMPLPKAPTK